MMKSREKFPQQKLLTEGHNDSHVVWALCSKLQLPENFDVIDCGGIANLLLDIPLRLKQSDIKTLGILVDADENISEIWNSLKSRLGKSDVRLSDTLPFSGLIHQHEYVKIGIWIMPNNKLPGQLEDFMAFLVPDHDQLMPVAHDVLNEIEKNSLAKYPEKDKAKALIHTWLAWQEDPGTPLGQSITKKYLTTDSQTCQEFINWLQELFSSDSI